MKQPDDESEVLPVDRQLQRGGHHVVRRVQSHGPRHLPDNIAKYFSNHKIFFDLRHDVDHGPPHVAGGGQQRAVEGGGAEGEGGDLDQSEVSIAIT